MGGQISINPTRRVTRSLFPSFGVFPWGKPPALGFVCYTLVTYQFSRHTMFERSEPERIPEEVR
jgi:hypothetical protein